MSKVRCVVFDSDGVIATLPNDRFSDRFAQNFPNEIHVMDFFSDGAYKRCRCGESTVEEEFPKYLEGTNWTLDSILKYWHEGDGKVDDNMLKFILKLRSLGVVCILATNQAACRTKYMLEEMGLGKYFDLIVASCDIYCEKPDIEFYQKVQDILFDKFGVRKDELMFFDDTKKNVLAAKDFGWTNSYLYTDFDEFVRVVKEKFGMKINN